MKYPENERILVVRPCLKTICLGVKPAAKLLSALLYQARNCPDEEPSFTIQWTQEQVIKAVCEEFTSKTLHDTAIPCLELLGYLDVDTSSYVYQYTLHLDLIHRALEVYSTPVELEKLLIVCIRSQLEKLLIELEKLPNQLEEVLIQLEKLLIVIRKTSNSKRGRKVKPQANSETISENSRLLEIDKSTKREEESEGKQSDTATSAPSLSLDAPLSDITCFFCSKPTSIHCFECGKLVCSEHGTHYYGEMTWCDLCLDVVDIVDAALSSSPQSDSDTSSQQQEIARTCDTCGRPQTEGDCAWCMTTRLPAIPKTPSLPSAVEPRRSGGPTPVAPAPLPGGTSPEQNRDAIPPRSVAVEVGPGAVASAPIPPVPSGSSPPRTMRATVVTCPPDRVPAPPKWDAQAMVARAEALREKPFSESARPKETRSARKLFARKPDLTEEEFTSAFQHWNTPWWRETNGLFCITDLAAVPKNKSEMRLIIALEKLAMPKKPPGGQVIQMPTSRGQQWRSSFDDPNYDMSAEFYPGTVAR